MDVQPEVKILYLTESAKEAALLEEAVRSFPGTVSIGEVVQHPDSSKLFVQLGQANGVLIRPYCCSIDDVTLNGDSLPEEHKIRAAVLGNRNYLFVNLRMYS